MIVDMGIEQGVEQQLVAWSIAKKACYKNKNCTTPFMKAANSRGLGGRDSITVLFSHIVDPMDID